MSQSLLTFADILAQADAYHRRTGRWPKNSDGPEWRSLDRSLRLGLHGLPSASSLAQLLAKERGVRNVQRLPPLTEELILSWADEHHQRTGSWPLIDSGSVVAAPGEVWQNVDKALRQGRRGLPGGSSLSQLLTAWRGVPDGRERPRLTIEQILKWADAHYERVGAWPHSQSGNIDEADGERWSGIDAALRQGHRGLPGGLSLYRLLKERRKAKAPRWRKRAQRTKC